MILSQRLSKLNPSKTVQLDSKVKRYIQDGVDIVNLGVGEPSEPTADSIKQAGIQAILQDQTRYSSPTGLLSLKEAICKKLADHNGLSGPLSYKPEQIIVSSGAKQCVFNALMATIDPGDEVFIPAPYWVTYPELVRLLGGIPVIIPTTADTNYKVTPELLSQYWNTSNKSGKLLILNTPCNPTGMVYNQEELEQISAWLVEHDLYCLSDEIYEYITFNDAKHISPAAVSKEMHDRTILINGMSKAYSMTGWRLGYTAAPLPLAQAIGALQSQSTHHPSNISQYAAIEAFKHDPTKFVTPMLKALHTKRELTLKSLEFLSNQEIKIHYLAPEGAFYVWIDVELLLKNHPIGIESDEQLAEYLLEKYQVALVPGSAFGQAGALRLSFATSIEKLKEGLERLSKGLQSLATDPAS